MQPRNRAGEIFINLVLIIGGGALIQSAVIVGHEFAHSIAAWMLGYTSTPFTVVWGNPLTAMGWDEGVAYDRLFPAPSNPAEAIIGGIPLVLHVTAAAIGLYLLQRPGVGSRKWALLAFYWFVVINLTELIAYFVMRPFARGGDTGHFDRGLELSPWLLFVLGMGLVLYALHALCVKTMPAIDGFVGRAAYWMIVAITGFVMFLGGSGIRVMVSVYPDPRWMFGLIGIAGFAGRVWANLPRQAAC